MGMGAQKELYERLGLDFEVLDSGCCALAGSFGFERDHDQISREIAEQRPGAPTPVLKSTWLRLRGCATDARLYAVCDETGRQSPPRPR